MKNIFCQEKNPAPRQDPFYVPLAKGPLYTISSRRTGISSFSGMFSVRLNRFNASVTVFSASSDRLSKPEKSGAKTLSSTCPVWAR